MKFKSFYSSPLDEKESEKKKKTVSVFNSDKKKWEIVFVGMPDKAKEKYEKLFKTHKENTRIQDGDWSKKD